MVLVHYVLYLYLYIRRRWQWQRNVDVVMPSRRSRSSWLCLLVPKSVFSVEMCHVHHKWLDAQKGELQIAQKNYMSKGEINAYTRSIWIDNNFQSSLTLCVSEAICESLPSTVYVRISFVAYKLFAIYYYYCKCALRTDGGEGDDDEYDAVMGRRTLHIFITHFCR